MCSLPIVQVVQQLQKQLENQKDVLKQYEPRLKKKEKEAKELTKVQYKNQGFVSLYLCITRSLNSYCIAAKPQGASEILWI
jgi:hypothetical protein